MAKIHMIADEEFGLTPVSPSRLTAGEVLAGIPGLAAWQWRLTTGRIEWTSGQRQLFGVDTAPSSTADFLALVHPDDRAAVLEQTAVALESPGDFTRAYRIVHPDGSIRHILSKGVVIRSVSGAARFLRGVSIDVTEQRRLEDVAERVGHRLAHAARIGSLVTWEFDCATGQLVQEGALAALFGLGATNRADQVAAYLRRIHPDDRRLAAEAIRRACVKEGRGGADVRVRLGDGSVRWVRSAAEGIERSGRVWVVGYSHDVTDDLALRDRLATSVTEAQEATRRAEESEARFRTLAASLPEMVWSSDAAGEHCYFNHRWEEYTGLAPQLAGREGRAGVFHPEDLPRTWGAWQTALASGEPFESECRLRSASGEYRWFLLRAAPLRGLVGQVEQWFGSCTDIQSGKEVEDRLLLLNGELAHRQRNLFTVMIALLRQTRREHQDADRLEQTLAARIEALSRAYAKLPLPGSTEFCAAKLQELLAEVLAPYRGVSLRLSDDVSLSESAAGAVALLIHELATNSVKYGALSSPDGSVEVVAGLDARRWTMTWTERGGRTGATSPSKKGFGSRLIATCVARLGAAWELATPAEGLRARLSAPAERVLAPTA